MEEARAGGGGGLEFDLSPTMHVFCRKHLAGLVVGMARGGTHLAGSGGTHVSAREAGPTWQVGVWVQPIKSGDGTHLAGRWAGPTRQVGGRDPPGRLVGGTHLVGWGMGPTLLIDGRDPPGRLRMGPAS
jgi:hypothetical protein